MPDVKMGAQTATETQRFIKNRRMDKM